MYWKKLYNPFGGVNKKKSHKCQQPGNMQTRPLVGGNIGYWRQGKAAAEGIRGMIKTSANEESRK